MSPRVTRLQRARDDVRTLAVGKTELEVERGARARALDDDGMASGKRLRRGRLITARCVVL